METGNPFIPILLTRISLLALREGNLSEAKANLQEANYRFLRYMYSSVGPYSQEILTHYLAMALVEEKAGHLNRSDSLAMETVRRSAIRLQLYLSTLSPAQRIYAISKFWRPYHQDLQRRVAERKDSALVSFGLWATYMIEFLETFTLSNSLFSDTTLTHKYLTAWKTCVKSYIRAEREKNFMQADSLMKEAQKYQAILWTQLNLPTAEATSFFDALQRRLSKREALLKVVPVKMDEKSVLIGYMVARRGKRITLDRVVFDSPEDLAVPASSQTIKATLPKGIRKLRVFTPIPLPTEFQKNLEATTGAAVSLFGQGLVWEWLVSR